MQSDIKPKERPILLNAEMVRAVLDGRKTQTRRMLTSRHMELIDLGARAGECYPLESGQQHQNSQSYYREFCPFGAVGDRLWVREAWQGPLFDEEQLDEFLRDTEPFYTPKYCQYAADGGPKPEYCDRDDNIRYGWRPSIHMPRWASRITLEITGVRVERLQGISEQDAAVEGVIPAAGGVEKGWEHRFNFRELWMGIYGADSWQANPFVWVVEFKRVEDEHA